MNVIKLTEEHVKAMRDDGFSITVGGEIYDHHDTLDEEMDDDGRTVPIILKRQSDGTFFETYLYWARYGYEWYGDEWYEFDPSIYELEMTQVAKVTKTIEVWEAV